MSRKKIDLSLKYSEILSRITAEKDRRYPEYYTSNKKWAEFLGVSPSLVSQLHPKEPKKCIKEPSLEYVVLVARCTKQPVEFFLVGAITNIDSSQPMAAENKVVYEKAMKDCPINCDDEFIEICKKVKEVVDSPYSYSSALKQNINSFHEAVEEKQGRNKQDNKTISNKILINRVKELEEGMTAGRLTGIEAVASSNTGKRET